MCENQKREDEVSEVQRPPQRTDSSSEHGKRGQRPESHPTAYRKWLSVNPVPDVPEMLAYHRPLPPKDKITKRTFGLVSAWFTLG